MKDLLSKIFISKTTAELFWRIIISFIVYYLLISIVAMFFGFSDGMDAPFIIMYMSVYLLILYVLIRLFVVNQSKN